MTEEIYTPLPDEEGSYRAFLLYSRDRLNAILEQPADMRNPADLIKTIQSLLALMKVLSPDSLVFAEASGEIQGLARALVDLIDRYTTK